jgi:hypothetical protein
MKRVMPVFVLLAALSIVTVTASTLPLTTPADSIIVNSTADSGVGTLRQALLDAQYGDTITLTRVSSYPRPPSPSPSPAPYRRSTKVA